MDLNPQEENIKGPLGKDTKMPRASYKQLNYLKRLLEDTGIEFSRVIDALDFDHVVEPNDLTVSEAIQAIEWLKEKEVE